MMQLPQTLAAHKVYDQGLSALLGEGAGRKGRSRVPPFLRPGIFGKGGAPETPREEIVMQGERSVQPTRIGQVAVSVEDVERATAFYRDVLGLEHLFSAPPGLSFFRCGDVRLMLARPEGVESGSLLPYYLVEDISDAHGALSAHGTHVLHEPHVVHRTESEELWMGFYRDSEGNVFGLMAEVAAGTAEG